MNRRTLDVLIPMFFAVALVVTLVVFDRGIIVVAAIGAVIMGVYVLAIRQHLQDDPEI